MEHLTKALNKIAKGYRLDPAKSYLGVIARYISTGDEKLLTVLLKLPEREMNTLGELSAAMRRPDQWTEADRRLARFFARRSAVLNGKDNGEFHGQPSDWHLGRGLERHLDKEKTTEDLFGIVRGEVMALKIPEEGFRILVARHFEPRAAGGQLTSVGRYLVSQAPKVLADLMPAIRYRCMETEFMPAFAKEAPEKLEAVMDELLRRMKADDMPRGGWTAGLEADPKRFESRAVAALEGMHDGEEKAKLAQVMEKHFPKKHSKQAINAASDIGAALGGEAQAKQTRWLIEKQGAAALPAIASYMEKWNLGNRYISDWKLGVLDETVKLLGREARGLFPLAMQKGMPELRAGTLKLWIELKDAGEDAAIEKQFAEELAAGDPEDLQRFIPVAASWNAARVAPRLGELLEHKSKPVREAAAHALAATGDAAIPRAKELLAAKKMDLRKAAVTLLAAIGTPAAIEVLQRHLTSEQSDDVRDLINKSIPKAATPAAKGTKEVASLKPDQKQVEQAIAKAAAKVKGPPAPWIVISKLPPLHFMDGKRLNEDAVGYLLYRQSREKEIVLEAEASLLYSVVDRKRSGDFALAVLDGYLGSALDAKDRWALAVAGMLGDDRLVPILTRKIDEWAEASRGKLAEYTVQALALLGSDAALLAVDAMAIRYRTKFKNIGKAASQAFVAAADARGLSPAELGDRVVPWLGFEPGKPRIFEFGSNRLQVSIGIDLKLAWQDLVKGKAVKTLPTSAPDAIKAEVKELSAGLKEAAKSQLLRVENLMVQQNRWSTARWEELFLGHPLLFPFATRLVWAMYDSSGTVTSTFRALEDRSLTDAADEPVTLPAKGNVGIVHPLDLTDDVRQAWLTHLADYNVTPPFAQLERPVVRATAAQANTRFGNDVAEVEFNAMTFKGRAERLGWSRGSVCDAGCINYYYKPFPAAGVDVFLGVEGMYVGIDMYSDVTLGKLFFVKHRSVQIGSYVYDEPGDEGDPRLVRFGDVPPIAYSEAMGDIARISGKSAAPNPDADAS